MTKEFVKLEITLLLALVLGVINAHGDTVAEGARDSELMGQWIARCYAHSEAGPYMDMEMLVEDEHVRMIGTVFSDSTCAAVVQSTEIVARYAAADGLLDTEFVTSFFTLHDPAMVAQYNQMRMFGRDDWQAGMAREVSQSANPVAFSIYEITDNSLRIGVASADRNGRNPESRHAVLSDFVYERLN